MDAKEIFLRSIEGPEFHELPAEEYARLLPLAKAGDVIARNRIVDSLLNLICMLCRRFEGRGVDLLDLVHIGVLAVIRKIHDSSVEHVKSFAALVTVAVRGDALHAVREGGVIRVPRSSQQLGARISQSQLSDVAYEIGIPCDEFEEDDGYEFDYLSRVNEAVESLPVRMKIVVKALLAGKTHREAGKLLGLSCNQAAAIEREAHLLLREQLADAMEAEACLS